MVPDNIFFTKYQSFSGEGPTAGEEEHLSQANDSTSQRSLFFDPKGGDGFEN